MIRYRVKVIGKESLMERAFGKTSHDEVVESYEKACALARKEAKVYGEKNVIIEEFEI